MHLVRYMFFTAAKLQFNVKVTHIAGLDNKLADSLSRLQVGRFRRLRPTADLQPSPLPDVLTEIQSEVYEKT